MFLISLEMPWAVNRGQESYLRRATRLLLYPIQTRLCARKLIAVSHNCTVMLGVLWPFDNLLWPEATDVPHIHLPRAASLNSKGFKEVHIMQTLAPTNRSVK